MDHTTYINAYYVDTSLYIEKEEGMMVESYGGLLVAYKMYRAFSFLRVNHLPCHFILEHRKNKVTRSCIMINKLYLTHPFKTRKLESGESWKNKKRLLILFSCKGQKEYLL